ncbi:MAG: hypothetical protein AAFO74_13030 [Pseudomonadota bacterium]
MAGTIESPDPNQPWIDPQTGKPTMYFFALMEDLLAGTSTNSIGTVLSGQNTTQAQVDGIVTAEQEAAAEDVTTDITVTPSKTDVFAIGEGTVLTETISIAVASGVAPYSISWERASGVSVTVNSPTSLVADGSFDVSFTRTLAAGSYLFSTQKVTVTDSAGTPMTGQAVINLELVSTEFGDTGAGGF